MTPPQPLLLDLFCGAGGAGEGYARAGFRVVGCDLDPRPLRHNPHECYQGDALAVLDTLLAGRTWQGYELRDFGLIHASPPCQGYVRCRHIRRSLDGPRVYPLLIGPVRDRLQHSGLPWVIENVTEAAPELPSAIMLCGTSFCLRVRRHRLFASSHLIYAGGPCRHRAGDVSVRRQHANYTGTWRPGITYTDGGGRIRPRPVNAPRSAAAAAMDIAWMTMNELGEAIPPAYTLWIGAQLLRVAAGRSDA